MMVQQVRVLAALGEEPGSIPSTHIVAKKLLRGSSALFWASWVPATHTTQTYMQAKDPYIQR